MGELVFNLDEVSISGWEDHKMTKAVLPSTMSGERMYHRLSRNVKQISGIITSQDSVSVPKQTNKHGVRFETYMVLKLNRNRYIDAEIFLDYIQTVFSPNHTELHRLVEFAE
jgi:hypothetical protein